MPLRVVQRLQKPSIKDKTLNYNRKHNKMQGIFLKQGVLESLGLSEVARTSHFWVVICFGVQGL